jgi:nucleotide-binding universal stress UspA family protein
MACLIGYTADRSGREALALGRMLALSADDDLIVCTVVPETWDHPSPARVDAEYAAFLDSYARRALANARATVGEDVRVEVIARSAPSAAEGLVAAAADTGAELIVLGSARHGLLGRFTLGSATGKLLQVTPVPVALVPRGYRPAPDVRVQRVTCAWVPAPGSEAVLAAGTRLSRRFRVPLRLATLIVRDRQMYPSGVGYDVENLVSNQWRTTGQQAQQHALAALPGDLAATGVIGDGPDWRKALDSLAWESEEVLVVGSSHRSPVERILLGEQGARLIRSSPVPVIVLPRGAGHAEGRDGSGRSRRG